MENTVVENQGLNDCGSCILYVVLAVCAFVVGLYDS